MMTAGAMLGWTRRIGPLDGLVDAKIVGAFTGDDVGLVMGSAVGNDVVGVEDTLTPGFADGDAGLGAALGDATNGARDGVCTWVLVIVGFWLGLVVFCDGRKLGLSVLCPLSGAADGLEVVICVGIDVSGFENGAEVCNVP